MNLFSVRKYFITLLKLGTDSEKSNTNFHVETLSKDKRNEIKTFECIK